MAAAAAAGRDLAASVVVLGATSASRGGLAWEFCCRRRQRDVEPMKNSEAKGQQDKDDLPGILKRLVWTRLPLTPPACSRPPPGSRSVSPPSWSAAVTVALGRLVPATCCGPSCGAGAICTAGPSAAPSVFFRLATPRRPGRRPRTRHTASRRRIGQGGEQRTPVRPSGCRLRRPRGGYRQRSAPPHPTCPPPTPRGGRRTRLHSTRASSHPRRASTPDRGAARRRQRRRRQRRRRRGGARRGRRRSPTWRPTAPAPIPAERGPRGKETRRRDHRLPPNRPRPRPRRCPWPRAGPRRPTAAAPTARAASPALYRPEMGRSTPPLPPQRRNRRRPRRPGPTTRSPPLRRSQRRRRWPWTALPRRATSTGGGRPGADSTPRGEGRRGKTDRRRRHGER